MVCRAPVGARGGGPTGRQGIPAACSLRDGREYGTAALRQGEISFRRLEMENGGFGLL